MGDEAVILVLLAKLAGAEERLSLSTVTACINLKEGCEEFASFW